MLGASVSLERGFVDAKTEGLRGATIRFGNVSVGATRWQKGHQLRSEFGQILGPYLDHDHHPTQCGGHGAKRKRVQHATTTQATGDEPEESEQDDEYDFREA